MQALFYMHTIAIAFDYKFGFVEVIITYSYFKNTATMVGKYSTTIFVLRPIDSSVFLNYIGEINVNNLFFFCFCRFTFRCFVIF